MAAGLPGGGDLLSLKRLPSRAAIGVVRLILAPIVLLVPSGSPVVDATRLAIFGAAAATFFLFAGTFTFPGGAEHFPAYAEAIVTGQKLDTQIAQRDAGYPLLLVVTGYPWTGSFLPIALLQAAFSALMPLMLYWAVVRVSPATAYYAGIAALASLAPFHFMKWIHHDHAYIFFMLVVVAILATFLQTRRTFFLYAFTVASVAASFMRPAGNLLFPVLLLVAYVTVRGRLVHYAACIMATWAGNGHGDISLGPPRYCRSVPRPAGGRNRGSCTSRSGRPRTPETPGTRAFPSLDS